MFELGLAAFVLAHAGVHTFFIIPQPPQKSGAPVWPFELSHSWLLSPLGVGQEASHAVGLGLIVVTIGGFALAALGILDLLPPDLALASMVVGAIGSLALLGLFFHPWLVLGILIDVVLVWLAFNGASPA